MSSHGAVLATVVAVSASIVFLFDFLRGKYLSTAQLELTNNVQNSPKEKPILKSCLYSGNLLISPILLENKVLIVFSLVLFVSKIGWGTELQHGESNTFSVLFDMTLFLFIFLKNWGQELRKWRKEYNVGNSILTNKVEVQITN